MVMGGGPDPAGDVLTALTNTFLELSRAGLAGDVLTHPPPYRYLHSRGHGGYGQPYRYTEKGTPIFPPAALRAAGIAKGFTY